jgi:hypothetical protein
MTSTAEDVRAALYPLHEIPWKTALDSRPGRVLQSYPPLADAVEVVTQKCIPYGRDAGLRYDQLSLTCWEYLILLLQRDRCGSVEGVMTFANGPLHSMVQQSFGTRKERVQDMANEPAKRFKRLLRETGLTESSTNEEIARASQRTITAAEVHDLRQAWNLSRTRPGLYDNVVRGPHGLAAPYQTHRRPAHRSQWSE